MSQGTFSWMNPAVFVGAFLLTSNLAYAQEGMRKGKYEEGYYIRSHKSITGKKDIQV